MKNHLHATAPPYIADELNAKIRSFVDHAAGNSIVKRRSRANNLKSFAVSLYKAQGKPLITPVVVINMAKAVHLICRST